MFQSVHFSASGGGPGGDPAQKLPTIAATTLDYVRPRNLAEHAYRIASGLAAQADLYSVSWNQLSSGGVLIDAGTSPDHPGSDGMGILNIQALLGTQAAVHLQYRDIKEVGSRIPHVDLDFNTDPIIPCMSSQYAGLQKKYGMGSGPIRAVICRDDTAYELKYRERPKTDALLYLFLERDSLPTEAECHLIAQDLSLENSSCLLMVVADTKSIVGRMNVAGRSVETLLHIAHHHKDNLRIEIVGATGSCPVVYPCKGSQAMGRTNDAMRYGGQVTLEVKDPGTFERLAALGPKLPTSAQEGFGKNFGELLTTAGGNFAKLNPADFSVRSFTVKLLDPEQPPR